MLDDNDARVVYIDVSNLTKQENEQLNQSLSEDSQKLLEKWIKVLTSTNTRKAMLIQPYENKHDF